MIVGCEICSLLLLENYIEGAMHLQTVIQAAQDKRHQNNAGLPS